MLNRDVRRTAHAWHAAGRHAVVVRVAEAKGSAPRRAGARMLVSGAAAVGTVGGGHLEWQAVAAARELLRGGEPFARHYPLGPALGQCCGGAVTLAFEPLSAATLAQWPAEPALFDLQLYGAGHVGQAIVRLLATLDCRVQWIDEREDMLASAERFGPTPEHVEAIAVDAVEGEVGRAPPGAFYLVLTYSHALDLRIAEAVLRRGDFGFFGLIGSATKRVRFVRRLEERGVDAGSIARMTCPVGVEGIGGKEPEIIAVAVVAQLLQACQRLDASVRR